MLDSFPPTVEIAGEARPWKYSLEATLSLVGGSGRADGHADTLFFTERTGGGTQLAGSPQFNVVFEADQKLIDALFTLTFGPRDPGPPAPAARRSAGARPTPAAGPLIPAPGNAGRAHRSLRASRP